MKPNKTLQNYPEADSLVHKNITIEGNTFHMSDGNVVIANKVDGLTIKNNTIIHDDDSLALNVNVASQINVGQATALNASVTETSLKPVSEKEYSSELLSETIALAQNRTGLTELMIKGNVYKICYYI